MLKKIISLFTVICLISSVFAIGAIAGEMPEAIDDTAPVSADAESVGGDGARISSLGKAIKQGTHSFDDSIVNEDLILDGSINTNITENSSKYNGMSSGRISEEPALSRYSTSRLALAPDIAGTEYEEAAELLGALGIMVGDAESGAFRPNDNIIRSEMAKVAVYAVGLEDVVKSSEVPTKFPDVSDNHWANGAINVAEQQGMVIGDDDGSFRPDDAVLLQEAVTIIVRAMGYEPAAEDKGGYPTGYLYIASTNQLLRGLSGSAAMPATRGDIAQLVFNAMTVNLMEQVGFGTNVSYEVVDKTLLYDKLNVEKGYGQITGTRETALDGGSTTDKDRILIDKNQYLEGDTSAAQMLGYNVLYYARIDKTTDDKTLINVRAQDNKNKVVKVNADDIVSVSGDDGENRSFVYWASPDDKGSKTANIAADAVYIYNGKYKSNVTTEQMKPKSGNVVLLDSDTNGIYEIVFVNHLTNLVVDTVSSVTGRVTDKYLNGSLVFDEDDTTTIYTLVKDGNEIGISDLKEWNVISYTISDDKELVKGYVSDAVINGSITESTDKGFRIGNSTERYKKAESYPNDIKLRDRGNFYLDIENKIAAADPNATVNSESASTENYAYLAGAVMNDGFDDTAQLKLFTKTGETAVMKTTSKLRLNTDYGQTAESVVKTLTASSSGAVGEIILYEVNSNNEITAVETAVDNTGTGAPNTGKFTMNIKKNDMIYKSASSKLGSVGISDSTIIFDIPSDAANDTDKFAVRNKSTLTNNSSYDAIIYDLQDNYTANVVVITNTTGVTAAESPILVVDYVSSTQNDEYEETDRVYGWQNGKAVDMIATDKTVLKKSSDKLEQGDIIQYRTNTKGEIDGISVLFNIKNKNTEFINEINDDLTTVYGKVSKKFSGSINMTVDGTVYNYATGDATVYLYDSTRNKNNIQVVSAGDIEIYEEGNEGRAFLRICQDEVAEIVIVK